MSTSRGRLRERPFQEFRDVESADVLAVLRLRGVVEHDQTVRTRRRYRVGPRLFDVAQPAVIHLLARPLVHPHPRPAGATAETAIAAFAHLADADTRDAGQPVTPFTVIAVVPSH